MPRKKPARNVVTPEEFRAAASDAMTEDQFIRLVIDMAKAFGWRTAHFRPAKTEHGWRTAVQGDGKGFPDLVLIRGGQLIFAELKAGENKPTQEQNDWLRSLLGASLKSSNVKVFLWYPRDLDDIENVLR